VPRGVDFEVAPGAIFALLGSNGAGKTTVVKILSTLLKADSGTARVNGFDVATQAADVRESISLTGQFAAVDAILSGRENLALIARLRHLKNPGAIAGLDPQARIEVWQAVRDLAEGGTTVLLTTQYLNEAEQLADRIAILHNGRIIAGGTLADLKQLLPPAKVEYVEKQPSVKIVVPNSRSRPGSMCSDMAHLRGRAVRTLDDELLEAPYSGVPPRCGRRAVRASDLNYAPACPGSGIQLVGRVGEEQDGLGREADLPRDRVVRPAVTLGASVARVEVA
jgi:ABC-2 type transport system ATP-binding protein